MALLPLDTVTLDDGVTYWRIGGRLLPLIAGADNIFPVVPDDLSTLSDAELSELRDQFTETARRATARDAEVVGDLPLSAVIGQVEAGLEQRDALAAELTRRETAAAAEAEQLAALAARADGADPNPDPEGEDDPEGDQRSADAPNDEPDPDAEPAEREPEAVAAAAPLDVERLASRIATAAAEGAARGVRRGTEQPVPARPAGRAPAPRAPRVVVTAAADIPGAQPGAALDRRALAQAVISRARNLGTSHVDGERVPVARVAAAYPSERQLDDDVQRTSERIARTAAPEAIVAAGGLCAPVEPYYGLEQYAVADRPVRDALVGFQATRGGIRYMPPPTLAGAAGSVGRVTAAQDAAGGPAGTKGCLRVPCDAAEEVQIAAVYHCLTFGNFGARAWPEQVETWTDLAMAAHARLAETALLDNIIANSTAVTAPATGGAVASLLPQIVQAVAGMRSRHRMGDGIRFRALLPEWLPELLMADQARAGGLNAIPIDGRAAVTALLRRFGIEPVYYRDTPTAGGQVFGSQAAAALMGFPTTVRWVVYPEGSFLFLDGGTLDFGLVRDSALNSTNDFQLFAETFENVAFIGIESLAVTSTICPNGMTQAAGTTLTCV